MQLRSSVTSIRKLLGAGKAGRGRGKKPPVGSRDRAAGEDNWENSFPQMFAVYSLSD